MKYLLILLAGISVGISGELLIPQKLYVTVGGGCIKQKSDGRVYMPELLIYDAKMTDFDYPIMYGGNPMTFVPSYRYAYALLTGELTYLSTKDCNSLIEKHIDAVEKERHSTKIKPRISHKPSKR